MLQVTTYRIRYIKCNMVSQLRRKIFIKADIHNTVIIVIHLFETIRTLHVYKHRDIWISKYNSGKA